VPETNLRLGASAARDPAVPVPRLIFLGGQGRSGSTVVERLLGELPGVCAAGEVVHLWQRGIALAERCGCGQPFPECPFWQKVGESAFGGWDNVDVKEVSRLRAEVDRTRFIPRLARPRLPVTYQRALDDYLSYYTRVYTAMTEVSGCRVIVDASKHASLAFCLRRSSGLDLRVIHMVRDPRAVAYSWTKQVSRPDTGQSPQSRDRMWTFAPASTAMQWNIQNGAMHLLAHVGTPVRLLRYEDVVRRPEAVLGEIASFAGLPDVATTEFLGADRANHWAELSVSHTVSGNPMRFSTGRIEIRGDERWRSAMPAAQYRAVTALTLPLLTRYGYLRRPQ
jgi:hypothetical protein